MMRLCSQMAIARRVPSRRTPQPTQTSAHRSLQPIRITIRSPIHSVAQTQQRLALLAQRDNSKPAQHSTMKPRTPIPLLSLSPMARGGTDSITVAINVTDVNEPPTLPKATAPHALSRRTPATRHKHRCCRILQPMQITIRLPIHSVARMQRRSALSALLGKYKQKQP